MRLPYFFKISFRTCVFMISLWAYILPLHCANTPEDKVKFEHPTARWTLTYPETWQKDEDLLQTVEQQKDQGKNHGLFRISDPNSGCSIRIHWDYRFKPGEIDVTEEARMIMAQSARRLPDIKEETDIHLPVGISSSITAIDKASGQWEKIWAVILKEKRRTFIFVASGESDAVQERIQLFDEIIKSFQIVENND